MLENIKLSHLKKLEENRLTLNHLFVLEKICKGEGEKVSKMNELKALERKELIISTVLTEKGKQFYEDLSGEEANVEITNPPVEELSLTKKQLFDLWWGTRQIEGAYPTTSYFSYEGKVFEGTRKMNVRKADTYKNFCNIIDKGEYTGEEIIQATKNHMLMVKRESLKTRSNKMQYVYNSERYLREKAFEGYLNISFDVPESIKVIKKEDLY